MPRKPRKGISIPRANPAVDQLAMHLRAAFHRDPVRELVFHTSRRWRFDLAMPWLMVAVEVDGGGWSRKGGPAFTRHGTGQGMSDDAEKFGAALEIGWVVVRCVPAQVPTGEALRWVEAAARIQEAAANGRNGPRYRCQFCGYYGRGWADAGSRCPSCRRAYDAQLAQDEEDE